MSRLAGECGVPEKPRRQDRQPAGFYNVIQGLLQNSPKVFIKTPPI
jgi:hypothetical protein